MSASSATSATSATPTAVATTPEQTLNFSGRLSLRITRLRDGASDGGSLLFEVEGREQAGRLLLQTVVGTLVARVRWGPDGAEAVTPQGRITAATLDDLARDLLGESLPMAALLQWLQGRPWASEPHELQAEGFRQLGWDVQLGAWHEGLITAYRAPNAERRQGTEILVRARVDRPSNPT